MVATPTKRTYQGVCPNVDWTSATLKGLADGHPVVVDGVIYARAERFLEASRQDTERDAKAQARRHALALEHPMPSDRDPAPTQAKAATRILDTRYWTDGAVEVAMVLLGA